ncbi:MAG TPA: hypothetical protein VIX14_00965 [Terriglobales bacterium]
MSTPVAASFPALAADQLPIVPKPRSASRLEKRRLSELVFEVNLIRRTFGREIVRSFMKPVFVLLAGMILWSGAAAQPPSDPCVSLREHQQAMESRFRD